MITLVIYNNYKCNHKIYDMLVKQLVRISKFLVLITTLLAFHSQAIVIRHDVADEKYRANVGDFPPLATFYIDGAHGTLIDKGWVITAAHASFCITKGSFVNIKGKAREVKNLYVHADYNPGKSHDIAIVELTQPVFDVEPASLYKQSNELNTDIWFIGIGGTGNGATGQTIDNGQNQGVLRKAQNKVTSADGPLLTFTFDRPETALPLEGVSGGGDSGGPAYIETKHGFSVLGVSSRFTNGKMGAYGINEIYSRVSYFQPWIKQIMEGNQKIIKEKTQDKLALEKLPGGLTAQNLSSVCQAINVSP